MQVPAGEIVVLRIYCKPWVIRGTFDREEQGFWHLRDAQYATSQDEWSEPCPQAVVRADGILEVIYWFDDSTKEG